MRKKNYFWLRLVSSLLDFSAIYCIALLFQRLLYQVTFISFGNFLIGIFISYFFLSYILLGGKTPAKIFTGLKVIKKNGEKATPVIFITREIFLKGLFGIWLPLYVFEYIPLRTHFLLTCFEMLLVVLFSAILLVVFKQTWWEWLSKSKTIKDQKVTITQLRYTCCLFAALYISSISIAIYPLLLNREILAISYPAHYPKTKEVKYYADYIKSHSQDPVDYIFDLFKKYDVVVISERLHPEYSQYEFIFKLIKDNRFTEHVGNIFTECGSVSYQDSLNNYLHSDYTTEDELNRATARLQRNSSAVWPLWSNTNLFDMFKTVYSINNVLPDRNKINWYFTDLPMNWETATHETYIKNYTTPDRDSLMAVQIIGNYSNVLPKQKRQKALVIMNTYHGYGLAPNGKNYFGGTAAYIMKALPGKVCNVMMNTISMKYLWAFVPVVDGKWDAAFELAGDPAAGFNFAGSPFGDDHFDARYLQIKGLDYKDVFTGFIFYTPLNKQFCRDGFPFEFENAEDELIKRGACVNQQYIGNIKQSIAYRKAHRDEPYNNEPSKLPIIYNLINGVAVPFLLFVCLTIILLLFFIKRKQTNKLNTIE
jgi:hypothetical protein